MTISTIQRLIAGAGVLCALGCSSPGPSAQVYNVRQFPGAQRETVFARAEQALLDLGYQLDTDDVDKGIITTMPVIGGGRGEPTHGMFPVGRATVRSFAEVRIAAADGSVTVYCRVMVQQLTTAENAMFMHDRSASDVPNDTPIDRDAATTAQQNELWTTIRRDRARERSLLNALSAP